MARPATLEETDVDYPADVRLALLFAERRGLGRAERSQFLSDVALHLSRNEDPDSTRGPFGTSNERRRGPEANPSVALATPGNGALEGALDEVVSVLSEATTVETSASLRVPAPGPGASSARGTAEEGIGTGDGAESASAGLASEDESCRDSVQTVATFSTSERVALEKYGSVFVRLHRDLDLLVLRFPRAGEAVAALLRELSAGLSGGRGDPELREASVLPVLERCGSGLVSALGGGEAGPPGPRGSNGTESAPSSAGPREEAVLAVEESCRAQLRTKLDTLVQETVARHFAGLRERLVAEGAV